MIHIFQHKAGKHKGKFDFCTIRKGKYISGSPQGYNRKKSVFTAIKADLKECVGATNRLVQDDTYKLIPVIIRIWVSGTIDTTTIKPKKKYEPGK